MFPEVDVENLKQSFRAETCEALVALEADLLELNEDHGNAELVARIFRALHSIKGSGAMLGFDGLAGFTHNLESAFNDVRSGRVQVSVEIVDLTLLALDQIRAMLDEEGDLSVDPQVCARILTRLRLMARSTKCDSNDLYAANKIAPDVASLLPLEQVVGARRTWRIRFAPGAELLRSGGNPQALINELRDFGDLSLQSDRDALPSLRDIDPERCYVRWEILLTTAAGEDAIRDVFIFVEDHCELSVEPLDVIENGAMQPHASQEVACDQIESIRPEEARAMSSGRRSADRYENANNLRVPAAKLDQFVDLVGELVTVQARLAEFSARHDFDELTEISEQVERLSSALRDNSMKIRMLPIRATFERFRRLVHDLARDLDKSVELNIEGADTELDRSVLDQLSDPLMHLVRNSMDHGIEHADLRAERGKTRMATINLSARQSGANVLIVVSDDGGGIDCEAVLQRAVERELIAPGVTLSEAETFALIFQPGFSTAKSITDVSGRGVGMDVVRDKVENLRGSIEVRSKQGVGTTITLRLPLTMAIIDGLLVDMGGVSFVLPLANTLECIELTTEDIAKSNGKQIVSVRGTVVPYIRLRDYFNVRTPRPEVEQIMLVETFDGTFGFVVDRVVGACQTVIKNLGRLYRNVPFISGASILGSGAVALILDPERLVQDALRSESDRSRGRMRVGEAKRRKRR